MTVRAGLPACKAAKVGSITANCSLASVSPDLAFFCAFEMRFSKPSMSAIINSVSTTSAFAQRIDRAFNVCDIAIFKTTQNVNDGIDLANVREELVAQPFTLGRAAHKAGDIDEF